VLTILAILMAGAIAGFALGYRQGRRSPELQPHCITTAPSPAWAEDATFRRMVSGDP
jgi:hypothetical protein